MKAERGREEKKAEGRKKRGERRFGSSDQVTAGHSFSLRPELGRAGMRRTRVVGFVKSRNFLAFVNMRLLIGAAR